MNPKDRRIITIILTVSALMAPFVLLSTSLKPWQKPKSYMSILQEIVYPIEYGWHKISGALQGTWRTYIDLQEAATDNVSLRRQLARLQTRIMDYEEQVKENARLRRLLGFASRYEKKLLIAEVIDTNSLSSFQSIRISRGKTDGVQVGMPIVAADGVVGRVIRIGRHFADVQLAVDPDFHLDVLLQRTRVRGVLSGRARQHCLLKLHKRAEIRIGDTVISSGIVGSFPKGLKVGRVIRITYESDNVAQAITVEPWVDYRRLEEVMILFNQDEQLQKIIETAGPDWLERSVRGG